MNTISKTDFRNFIEKFDFTNLFNLLGWNYIDELFPVKAKEETYIFHSVAEKGGFRIIVFEPDHKLDMPDYATRLQLDRKIGQLYREHLLIFCDRNKTRQIWQIFVRQLGKPSRLSETKWVKGQEPELLYQKTSNLFFTLDEEDHITIADVVDKVTNNFVKNVEQVTKKFYENFRKEHKQFIKFISGIASVTDLEWYASLMLNRLMFCYFIQKKGFLDNNRNYLKEKLHYCQQQKGKDQFYVSFYKNFLIALFHDGLGSPNKSDELKKEIGRIPYLNGGLFDVHELEKQYNNIDVSDAAFEKIFQFFDQYNWHLDNRPSASGKDINPDVIGYIFEKYINDRAQMGAYYTKEDITDYIGKNCIIPFLFDETSNETSRKYPKAFKAGSEIWQMLKESGDTYIYPAIKHGISVDIRFKENEPSYMLEHPVPLPPEIEIGLETNIPGLMERRRDWNKPAPAEVALPTEIWREVIDRRNRYWEVSNKIEKGEITGINDFITYNLNIRQFAQDVIDTTNDPDFLRHFYETLSKVTILDPTCGSGAFLFAAMNILEPLYEGCLQRMENFVSEAPQGRFHRFEEILTAVKAPEHPNLQYFIFKSIILRNLYGVDIMKEAVEIAKLRLFLKLVATVEVDQDKDNFGLEPLPDIDFNIRSGNTLIGFTTLNEAIQAINQKDKQGQMGLVFEDELDIVNSIKDKADDLARIFKSFKNAQLFDDPGDHKKAKDTLLNYQSDLNNILNEYLAFTYDIDKQKDKDKYKTLLKSHQPFHWFAEFHEIIHSNSGFDVVIGNPPYVVYASSSFEYKIKDFITQSCANLYAFCIEQSCNILQQNGRFGMIIPNSGISADKLSPLQKIITEDKSCWISNYAWRPAKLFEGANMLLAIILLIKDKEGKVRTSKYYKWYNDYRNVLFENISFQDASTLLQLGTIPKIPSSLYYSIFEKQKKKSGSNLLINFFSIQPTKHLFFYFRAVLYWVKILEFEPIFLEDGIQTATGEMKPVFAESEELKYSLISLLSSSLFFVHYITWSSCQVINNRDFGLPFNFTSLLLESKLKLINLGKQFEKDLQQNSIVQKRNYSAKGRSFTMEKQYFYIKKSKTIINEIDTILAEHYDFSEEELDFIINYDIKYRMGKELENGEEND